MASRACHGLHCLGVKDCCYLPHRLVDVSEQVGLASEDIKQIISVSIVEENLPSCSWPESSTENEPDNTEITTSDSEGSITDDSTAVDYLSKLRRELGKANEDGI